MLNTLLSKIVCVIFLISFHIIEIWDSDPGPGNAPIRPTSKVEYLDPFEDTLVVNDKGLYVLVLPTLPGEQFMVCI